MLQRTQPHSESCWPTTAISRRTSLVSSRWYQAWRLFPDMTPPSPQFDVIVSHLDEPEVRPEFACYGGNVLLWDKSLSSLFNECLWRVGYLVKMALKLFESTVAGLNQILSRRVVSVRQRFLNPPDRRLCSTLKVVCLTWWMRRLWHRGLPGDHLGYYCILTRATDPDLARCSLCCPRFSSRTQVP